MGHFRFRGYVGRGFESSWPSSHFTSHECLRESTAYHVSVRVHLRVYTGWMAHISCSSAGHLYRASPNARVGSKPPSTRPLRITLSLSSAGCSERNLQRWWSCGLNELRLVSGSSPISFFHVSPSLVLAKHLNLPCPLTISTFLPYARYRTAITSTRNVEISSRGIEDG